MRRSAVLTLCGLLAACQPAAPEPDDTAPAQLDAPALAWTCLDGEVIETRLAGDGPLQLTRGGRQVVLRPAEAVSGARWIGEQVEWWVLAQDGRERATLRRLGPDGVGDQVLTRCEREAPEAAALIPPPGAPGPCRTPDLRLELVGQDAGAGSRGATFALTNAGSAPCRLEGRPRIALVGDDRAGALAVNEAPGETGEVRLDAGGRAWFDLLSSAMPHGDEPEPCPQVTAVRAGAPGDAAWTAEAALDIQPCGGAVRVTPLRAAEQR